MNKKQVWENIKQLEITYGLKREIFELIEENIDRVDFVKDHIGLRDFLFISEDKTETFIHKVFVALDVESEPSNTFRENTELLLKKVQFDKISVVDALARFFNETDRKLFVAIGFQVSEIKDNSILKEMREGEELEEVLKRKRKFPYWYNAYAKMPEEVTFLTIKSEQYLSEILKPSHKVRLKEKLVDVVESNVLSIEDRYFIDSIFSRLTINE